MAQSIWGFGSLLLESDGSTITFDNAIHNIRYRKLNVRHTSITGRIHLTTIRYRPIILAQISICTNTDVTNCISLITMLNDYINNPVYCTPQYSTTNSGNEQYIVYLLSDLIVFEQLANALVGQTINIELIGRDVIFTMPTNVSNPMTYMIVDESLNQYEDLNNNEYIMNI